MQMDSLKNVLETEHSGLPGFYSVCRFSAKKGSTCPLKGVTVLHVERAFQTC